MVKYVSDCQNVYTNTRSKDHGYNTPVGACRFCSRTNSLEFTKPVGACSNIFDSGFSQETENNFSAGHQADTSGAIQGTPDFAEEYVNFSSNTNVVLILLVLAVAIAGGIYLYKKHH